ncbi:MAG: aspartyl/glutamyl-tRNA amidotransferase subunit A [Candidatus Abawacabacteria bacterium RBG_16_42_10]|uniref:Glutamyl-tRNA(Gln) amidotransferase subunit A n=1 Tax=Candidatus Abawacabacteria bacterium RBG_16_42_10 TaxID=1817814 RepID=A0A1F4XL14_9BACT|nr:MAG: aspartyl/glutamyl-tRNA amidotransferase subunit A [Candidatus Abawacabacteria bacterium RBG_16_42_10]
MSYTNLTISTAHQMLSAGKISPIDLTKHCLEQIEKTDPTINACITVIKEQAIAHAEDAAKRYKNGEPRGILDGIPLSIKDVFCIRNIRTTAASHILENFVPPYDATVIGKLKNAGAIFVSKTNTDEFTCGASTETSAFGVTKNPWNTETVAGGSSGGSAASIASGQCLGSLGTDTGGSIRQPAAFCNVTGLKVTYGRVSRYGVISMASSLDTIGPLARSAEDCAHLLEIIAGFDPNDSTTPQVPLKDYSMEAKKALPKYRIGIPQEYFGDALTEETKIAVESAAKVFEKMGCTLIPLSLPHTKYAVSVYYILSPSEVSSNMSRYDGIRFGPGPKKIPDDLQEYFFAAREEGFGDEMKRRIMIGTYALSAGYYDAYYKKAQKVRTLIIRDFEEAFKNVDALLTPVSPYPAFKIGDKSQDPLQMYLADTLTIPSSLAGIPGISLPCGFTSEHLPIGLQLLSPAFTEERLLQLGFHYQTATHHHLTCAPITI